MLAPTPSTDFSDIVEAVRAVEEHQRDADLGTWTIGLKAIDHAGPPAKSGTHTGSAQKFDKMSEAVVKAGYDKKKYSAIWFRKVRDATYAFMFPADRRLSAYSFWVHQAARNPNNLDQIVKEVKKVTVDNVKNWLDRQNPKAKRRSDVIAKHQFLSVLRKIEGLLANLTVEVIKGLKDAASKFIAACDRELEARAAPLREAAE